VSAEGGRDSLNHFTFILFFTAAILFGPCSPLAAAGITENEKAVIFQLKQGEMLDGVAKRLKSAGVIGDIDSFKLAARISGRADSLRAGYYLIEPHESYDTLLDKLVSGRSHAIMVTIPEGFTIFKIAALLERKGLVKSGDFLAACADKELIKKYNIPAGLSLEGYLYPETYSLPLGSSAAQIVRIFTGRFDAIALTIDKAALGNRSLHQLLTMASIVEREARVASERPLIAGVYYNRLKTGMKLQADPTLIYALELRGDYDGDIRREHFTYDSPYNTYRYYRLPPGPIGNPGIASIRAALAPQQSEYLYFVAKPDGSHQFSKTLEEHNRAVDQYQRGE